MKVSGEGMKKIIRFPIKLEIWGKVLHLPYIMKWELGFLCSTIMLSTFASDHDEKPGTGLPIPPSITRKLDKIFEETIFKHLAEEQHNV